VERLLRPTVRATKTSILTSSRDHIRVAAKTIFAERGYEATTTAAICRLAGTSQFELIKHFTNKHGVLEVVFEYTWEQLERKRTCPT
jgi:TetR/AcrR family transcriptional regulator, regulator of cefoperazone and chloramphenicol sensitivity